jgi:hypothetical protein
MSSFLDKLNLRPQERRLVVGAGAVLFVVLQIWLVRPYFKEWGQVTGGLTNSRQALATYRAELAKTNEYYLKLKEFEDQGTGVLAPDQAQPTILMAQVQAQADRSKLNLDNISPKTSNPATSKTNPFFAEQAIGLGVRPSSDEELIGFLVAMGSSDLKIRVRDLTLNPDPTGTKLKGSMVLVASFQKPTSTRLAAVKPTGTSPKKP